MLAAASRGEERRREEERMDEGSDKEGGREGGCGGEGQSEWMTDALWLQLLPSVHRGCLSLCGAKE